MDIKSLYLLTRAERREAAHAAAERGEPVHEACPHAPGTPENDEFHSDYIAHRYAPAPERA